MSCRGYKSNSVRAHTQLFSGCSAAVQWLFSGFSKGTRFGGSRPCKVSSQSVEVRGCLSQSPRNSPDVRNSHSGNCCARSRLYELRNRSNISGIRYPPLNSFSIKNMLIRQANEGLHVYSTQGSRTVHVHNILTHNLCDATR